METVTEATAELRETGHSTLMRTQRRTILASFHLLTERETTPGRMTLMEGNRVSGMGVIMGLLTQGMGGCEDRGSAREVLQVLLMATPLYNDMLQQQEWLRGWGKGPLKLRRKLYLSGKIFY